MTRIISEGFEQADNEGLQSSTLWNNWRPTGELPHIIWGPLVTSGWAYPMVPRTGRGMASLYANQFYGKDFGAGSFPTELYVGVAFNTGAWGNFDFIRAYTDDAGVWSNNISIRCQNTGIVQAVRSNTVIASSSAGAVTLNTWNYMEVWFKPLDSGGRVVVKVDGSTVIDFTGDTTAEEEWINAILFGGISNSTSLRTFVDDIVVNSSDGSYNNTWPGQVRLLPIRPYDAGNYSQWDRGGVDLGNDAAQVRNGYDFSMMQTDVADEYQTFVPDIPDLPVGATISNIIVRTKGKVEAGSGVVAPMIRQNGVDDIGDDFTLSTGWLWTEETYPINPDTTSAWVEADLADLEIGFSS